MVPQEGLPTVELVRRSGAPRHVARDSSLGNVESQLLELAMDARCAPTVVVGHPPDQLTDFEINSRTARRAFSRLPRPEDTEALAMPPNDRVRLYDDEGITPVCFQNAIHAVGCDFNRPTADSTGATFAVESRL